MKNTIKQQVVVKQSCQIKENHLVNTYVEDPRQQPSGMTALFNNPSPALSGILSRKGRGKQLGFTLIELLVVVLIIGILAAVAVPQYQKAVMKSRVAEAKIGLKALQEAVHIAQLEKGSFIVSMNDLNIELPFSNNWEYVLEECTSIYGCSFSAYGRNTLENYVINLIDKNYDDGTLFPGFSCFVDYASDKVEGLIDRCKKMGFTKQYNMYSWVE